MFSVTHWWAGSLFAIFGFTPFVISSIRAHVMFLVLILAKVRQAFVCVLEILRYAILALSYLSFALRPFPNAYWATSVFVLALGLPFFLCPFMDFGCISCFVFRPM